MKRLLFSCCLIFFICNSFTASAGKITGQVTDDKGNALAYASILIKGTGKGTTANNQGVYLIPVDAGNYTIVCQYVGYARQEKTITVNGNETVTLNFRLSPQQTTM